MGVLRLGVLGAGVVGANSALALQSEYPTANITLIADKFYQDTTSDGAAGIFRPGNEFSGPNDQITEQWVQDSYDYYRDLINVEPACGVSIINGYHFTNKNAAVIKSRVLEKVLPLYRAATTEELYNNGNKWKYGFVYETLLIECPRFLPWALTKFQAQGGHIRNQTIGRLAQLQGEFDVLVNCCGLRANYLCDDRKMSPVRGQVIKVNAPWLKNFYYDDNDTYIIPHTSGLVTLGGTRNMGSYNIDVCRHDTASILERCFNLVPQLKEAPIMQQWVGLRPYRAITRVEAEQLGTLKIVHNYGHGGYGVTTAPGTSKQAVQLVRHILTGNSKL